MAVVAGGDVPAVCTAFGIDPDDPVYVGDELPDEDVRLASVEPVTGGVVVVEDIGLEGSRREVLEVASRGGKAASVYWDVDGMVVLTLASRGKVAFAGEIDSLEDAAELEGLPRSLTRFVDLAIEDDADPVALGAAMVSSFTRVEFGPESVTEQWRGVRPVVDAVELVTPESSGLHREEPELLAALLAVPPEQRWDLTSLLTRHAAARASLAEDPVVAQALRSVGRPAAAEVRQLEQMESRASQVMDRAWRRQMEEDLDEVDVEDTSSAARAYWLAKVLRHACSHDEISAMLGVAEASQTVHMLEDLGDEYVEVLLEACRAEPARRADVLGQLGEPPSALDRERAAADRQQRGQDERAERSAHWEMLEWNGVRPTDRMREAGIGAHSLARVDPNLLVELDAMPDEALRELARWAAEQLLHLTGLLDRPWLAEHRASLGQLDLDDEERGQLLDGLSAAMDDDHGVPWSTYVDEEGHHVSQQHFALPVVVECSARHPLSAAAHSLSTAREALGPAAWVPFADLARRRMHGGGR